MGNQVKTMIEEKKETPKTPIKKALSKPIQFQAFVIWMATPEPLREPLTQKELALKIGVGQDTLSEWKQRNDFWKRVELEWNAWGREKTNNVVARFYQKIISKDVTTADFKLWFQFFLEWKEKTEIAHSGEIKLAETKVFQIITSKSDKEINDIIIGRNNRDIKVQGNH